MSESDSLEQNQIRKKNNQGERVKKLSYAYDKRSN